MHPPLLPWVEGRAEAPLFRAGLVSPHGAPHHCHCLERRPDQPPKTRALGVGDSWGWSTFGLGLRRTSFACTMHGALCSHGILEHSHQPCPLSHQVVPLSLICPRILRSHGLPTAPQCSVHHARWSWDSTPGQLHTSPDSQTPLTDTCMHRRAGLGGGGFLGAGTLLINTRRLSLGAVTQSRSGDSSRSCLLSKTSCPGSR